MTDGQAAIPGATSASDGTETRSTSGTSGMST